MHSRSTKVASFLVLEVLGVLEPHRERLSDLTPKKSSVLEVLGLPGFTEIPNTPNTIKKSVLGAKSSPDMVLTPLTQLTPKKHSITWNQRMEAA